MLKRFTMRFLHFALFFLFCLSTNAQYLYLDTKQNPTMSYDLNQIGSINLTDSTLIIKKQIGYDSIPLNNINKMYYNLDITNMAKLWAESENSIVTYPNPCVNNVNFKINLKENAKVYSKIIDVNGALIMQHLIGEEFNKGITEFSITLPSGISAGSYFYVTTINSEIHAQPFIISSSK